MAYSPKNILYPSTNLQHIHFDSIDWLTDAIKTFIENIQGLFIEGSGEFFKSALETSSNYQDEESLSVKQNLQMLINTLNNKIKVIEKHKPSQFHQIYLSITSMMDSIVKKFNIISSILATTGDKSNFNHAMLQTTLWGFRKSFFHSCYQDIFSIAQAKIEEDNPSSHDINVLLQQELKSLIIACFPERNFRRHNEQQPTQDTDTNTAATEINTTKNSIFKSNNTTSIPSWFKRFF